MSTSAQVIFSNNENLIESKPIWSNEELQWLIDDSWCILYNHRNGNPENIISWIFKIFNLSHEETTGYLNATMLWYWKHTENELTKKIQDWHTNFNNEENYRQLWSDHWVFNKLRWSIAYLYIVYVPSKTVYVLEYNNSKDHWNISQTHNYNL